MIIEVHYLPSVNYFTLLKNYNEVTLDLHSNFEKQTFRNRCYILNAQLVQEALIIPVHKLTGKKTILKEVKIDYYQSWMRQHLGSLKANYGKAPFYEFYMDYFDGIYKKKIDYLAELNFELMTLCLKLLKWNNSLNLSVSYIEPCSDDYRNVFHPKKSLIQDSTLNVKPYRQNFGDKFVENLSIIDVLMCVGPKASQYI